MISWLEDAIDNAEVIINWCWDFIITNSFLQMLLVISIIPVGFYIFSRARSAAGASNKDE